MYKVRAIALNYNVSKIVNFDVIKIMILRGYTGKVHRENKIKRKRAGGATVAIFTELEDKR